MSRGHVSVVACLGGSGMMVHRGRVVVDMPGAYIVIFLMNNSFFFT